jgi:hypothetical protein
VNIKRCKSTTEALYKIKPLFLREAIDIFQVVKKNSTDAASFIPMFEEEIIISPVLEFRVV